MLEFIAGSIIGVFIFIIFIVVSDPPESVGEEIEREKSLEDAKKEVGADKKIHLLADHLGIKFSMEPVSPFFPHNMDYGFVLRAADPDKLPVNLKEHNELKDKLDRLFDYLKIEELIEPGEPARPARFVIKKKSK